MRPHYNGRKETIMPKYFSPDDNVNGGNQTAQPTAPVITPELQKLIDEAVANKDKEWQGKVNETEKGIRLRLQKEAEQAKMSAEEKAKADVEEQRKAMEEEIKALKGEKAQRIRESAIANAKLPPNYQYDVRILNAQDDELPSIIKAISKEYDGLVESWKKGSSNTTPLASSSNISGIDMNELAKTNPAEFRRLMNEKEKARKK